MDFTFSDEQVQLRSSLQSYLAERNGFERRVKISRSEPGWSADLWRGLAEELGIIGAALPESVGGIGGGPVETMIIMEELGASLVLEPYFETAVVAAGLLQAGGREAELEAIVRGDARYAFAWAEPEGRYRYHHVGTRAVRDGSGWRLSGMKAVVGAAPWATHLLVSARTGGDIRDRDGISLFLVDPAACGVAMRGYPTIDGRRAADIRFDDVQVDATALVGTEGTSLSLIEKVGDVAIAALGAEALGVMRRLVQDTIDYTRQRRQFGQPISSFQALQHRMVDMFMKLELATSAVYLATLSLDADATERAKAASAAKVSVGQALRFIGQNAVQLHGGMGMTDELPVGHYFKRATVIEGELGSTDYHLARYAELSKAAA
ncbi:acyl-CoA dehydrogenase family protein [Sphingosinithalassobacter portus]|uniref:acyl-CoA dehydrogenase family protein n=1 Tax=Stakelama portus TaxID=2676234 RepID=UPI000D6E93F2|nr:acyl-CoA dehydrogenase family protein [Sphingosinithalassobacter portus]